MWVLRLNWGLKHAVQMSFKVALNVSVIGKCDWKDLIDETCESVHLSGVVGCYEATE